LPLARAAETLIGGKKMKITEELKLYIEKGTHHTSSGQAMTMEAMVMQRALEHIEELDIYIEEEEKSFADFVQSIKSLNAYE
jgi:hypothetical protein